MSQFFNTQAAVKEWLDKYNVPNYTIKTINENLIVDVDGPLILKGLDTDYLPVQFGEVSGSIEITSAELLQSLEGLPKMVEGKCLTNIEKLTQFLLPEEVKTVMSNTGFKERHKVKAENFLHSLIYKTPEYLVKMVEAGFNPNFQCCHYVNGSYQTKKHNYNWIRFINPSLLMRAIQKNDLKLFDFLVEQGATIDNLGKDVEHTSPKTLLNIYFSSLPKENNKEFLIKLLSLDPTEITKLYQEEKNNFFDITPHFKSFEDYSELIDCLLYEHKTVPEVERLQLRLVPIEKHFKQRFENVENKRKALIEQAIFSQELTVSNKSTEVKQSKI